MPIEIKNYPALIAVPYAETLKKDSIQRKDFQRLALENVLTLNAIICLADFYDHNRIRTEETDKKFTKLDRVANIDLGQISVGTWNMFGREFTRTLKSDAKNVFISNLVDLYHGGTAKDWENIAGSLITIRNKDAHGELIAADKLSAELDKRQDILDKLINIIDFYKDYSLIVPISIDLVEGKVQYTCKDFSGATESSIIIDNSKDELETMRVYLFNKKKNTSLCLNPMIQASYVSKENKDIKLFVYSKTTNKKLGNIHFISIDSSRDFNVDDNDLIGDFFTGAEICEEFQAFRIQIEDPSLHDQKKPALNITRLFKNDFISKEDLVEINLNIKNEGESGADDVRISFNYPIENFNLCNADGEIYNLKNTNIQTLIGDELSIDAGQTYSVKFFFKPVDAGQYEFPGINIEYEYTDFQGNVIKPKTEKDGTQINIETAPAIYCTIYDPGDPFSLAPVINVQLNVNYGIDEKGKQKNSAYIGEIITFGVEVTNSGLGVAKDVDFTVFPSDGLRIKSGSTYWKGNLNPLTKISKSFEIELLEPGIHNIGIRELIFTNQDNIQSKTLVGPFNILVRNKPEVQYRQLMNKVWADLSLDDDEIEELKYFSKKFGKLITEETKALIETDEKMKVIKSILTANASSKGFKLIEKIAIGKRLIYAYNSLECPILVVDYSNPKDISMFLRADLQGKYPIENITIKGNIRNIPMSKIGMSEYNPDRPQDFTGGASVLKGLIGRAIGWIEKHDWLQLQLRNNFAKAFSISNDQLSAKLFHSQMYYKIQSEGNDTEYMVREFATYFDTRNNLHLVAKVDADLNVRKKLVEKGYKFVAAQGENSIAYADSTNPTTYMYVGTVRINNEEDRDKFAALIVKMILIALEEQNYLLEGILKKKGIEQEQITSIMNIHNTLLETYSEIKDQEKFIGLIYKFEYEEKGKNYELGFTYFAVKELPLYQSKQIVFRLEGDKKGNNLYPRNFDDSLIEKYPESFLIRKSADPYLIESINDFSEDLKVFLKSSILNSGDFLIKPGYNLIKKMMEEEWVTSIHKVIEYLLDNGNTSNYDEIQNFFDENNIPGGIQGIMKQLKVSFARFGFENILESSATSKLIEINNKYLSHLIKARNNYHFYIDPKTTITQILKQIWGNLIINKDQMPDHVFQKHSGSYSHLFGLWLDGRAIVFENQNMVIKISISIMKNSEINDKIFEKIANDYNNEKYINNYKIEYIKSIEKIYNKGAQAAKIYIPYNNFIDLIDNDWLVNFFSTFTAFCIEFLPKEIQELYSIENYSSDLLSDDIVNSIEEFKKTIIQDEEIA